MSRYIHDQRQALATQADLEGRGEIWVYASNAAARRLMAWRWPYGESYLPEKWSAMLALALSPDGRRFLRVLPGRELPVSRRFHETAPGKLVEYDLAGKKLRAFGLPAAPPFTFGWLNNHDVGAVFEGHGYPGEPALQVWTSRKRKLVPVGERHLPSSFRSYTSAPARASTFLDEIANNPFWVYTYVVHRNFSAFDPRFGWTLGIGPPIRSDSRSFLDAYCSDGRHTFAWRRDLFGNRALLMTMRYPRICAVGQKGNMGILDIRTGDWKPWCANAVYAVVVRDGADAHGKLPVRPQQHGRGPRRR